MAARPAGDRGRPLLPARPRAARSRTGAAPGATGRPGARRGAAGARCRAAEGHAWRTWRFASLRSPSSSSGSARCSAAGVASTSTAKWPGSRGSSRLLPSSPCSSCTAGEASLEQASPSCRSGFPAPTSKGHPVETRPLRLITSSRSTRSPVPSRRCWSSPRRPLRSWSWRMPRDDEERVETALGLLRERYRRDAAESSWNRSRAARRVPCRARGGRRVLLDSRTAGRARIFAGGARDAGDRRLPRSVLPSGDRADPGVAANSAVASLVERGLITKAGREDGPGGAVRLSRDAALRARVRAREPAALPRLDDVGEDAAAIRTRLLEVAEARAS